jgi:cell division protein ZapE
MRSPTRSRSSISATCPILRSKRVSEAPSGQDLRQRYQRALAQRHFQCDAAQLEALERLQDLRERLLAAADTPAPLPHWLAALGRARARTPVKGLYLWGGVGRGKTWLMDLFFASLPPGLARRRHFHRFMYEVHRRLAQLKQQRSPLEKVAQAIAQDCRVLCFDELYVADIADAMILGALFAGLFSRGVTLVVTSNVPPQLLYQDGLQRQRFLPAIELLEQHLEVLKLSGTTDHRLRQLTQAGTYLASGDPRTRAQLEELFERLAGHGPWEGGSIEIAGRPIAVIRVSPAVVWFGFQALCAGPRSQDDYIEIAREYQSVLVSDVPVFDELRENEARRFIALVDELYDRNVNLVVSAAAAPRELYRGERLQGLFARTASRLIEMQSEDYLGREHRP